MTTLNMYRTYRFKNKDPVIDQLRTMVQDSGDSYAHISQRSGVSATTLYNWFNGGTKRPQSASVEAVGRSLGYKRDWVRIKEKK